MNNLNIIEDITELANYDSKTPKFSLDNEIHLGKVVKCYDGDTIHCIFKCNNKYSKSFSGQ